MRETDQSLRRIERDGWIACAAMTLAAWAASDDWRMPASVLAGGSLAGLSYRAIKAGADVMTSRVLRGDETAAADKALGQLGGVQEAPPSRRRVVRRAAGFAARYALLAILAYVMIARLRLSPIGLLGGASSMVIAVAAEAVRMLRNIRG